MSSLNSYPPGTSECDLIWKQSLCQSNSLRIAMDWYLWCSQIPTLKPSAQRDGVRRWWALGRWGHEPSWMALALCRKDPTEIPWGYWKKLANCNSEPNNAVTLISDLLPPDSEINFCCYRPPTLWNQNHPGFSVAPKSHDQWLSSWERDTERHTRRSYNVRQSDTLEWHCHKPSDVWSH